MTKYSNAYIERIFSLEPGYIEKNQLTDPCLTILLSLIDEFPFLVTVAKKGFDPIIAKRELVKDAIDRGLLEKQRLCHVSKNGVRFTA